MTADVIDMGQRVKELRLPQWVQDELTEMRTQLAEARLLVEAIVPPIDTDRTNTLLGGDEPVGLPHGSIVRFRLGLRDDSYLEVRAAGQGVLIEATRPIVLRPIGSTALTVEIGR